MFFFIGIIADPRGSFAWFFFINIILMDLRPAKSAFSTGAFSALIQPLSNILTSVLGMCEFVSVVPNPKSFLRSVANDKSVNVGMKIKSNKKRNARKKTYASERERKSMAHGSFGNWSFDGPLTRECYSPEKCFVGAFLPEQNEKERNDATETSKNILSRQGS